MVVLKTLLITAIKKAGAAVVEIIAERLLTKELFYDVAMRLIRSMLIRWKDSTANTLDDDIVGEMLRRLEDDGT